MCLEKEDEEELDPTVQLWLYQYLSQHYMRYAEYAGSEYYDKSMEYIDKAIEHTPTVLELYIHKAKLYQRMGNAVKAAKFTEEARKLDLADRYLNAHSSKYLMKADKIQEANDTMSLFSKDQENGTLNVHEMATFWYFFHCGMANFRLGNLREAVKEFQYVEKHYISMFDECCDFFYCSMRKGTMMHYLNMWEWQSNIYKGKLAVRGCILLLKAVARIKKVVTANPALIEEAKVEYDAYMETEEYKKWLVEFEKNEENNDLRNDPDPKGWKLYIDLLKDPTSKFTQFAYDCCSANPMSAELQVKCLDNLIHAKNTEYALEAASNIARHHSKYSKSKRAIEKFKAYLKDVNPKMSQKAQEQLKEFQDNLLPAFEKNPVSKDELTNVLEHAYEALKNKPSDK